jgi:uncharacterized sulfatase
MLNRLTLACISLCFCLASPVFAQPPNIVWIFGDDYSAMNFGAYGNTLVNTPNIDKLAAEGVVFDNAFVPNPICSPMRSSLITGMYPTSIDVQNHRSHGPSKKIPYQTGYTLPDPVAHLAELFKAGGYYTMSDDKGDYNFNMETTPWDTGDWDAAVKNQPFFAIREIDKTSGAADAPLKPSEVEVPPYYADEPEIRKILAKTLNGISTKVDPMVERFMVDIESAGIGENTIVFFFADHGKHGFRAKQWLYDTGLKVPLIVWWRGDNTYVKPGTRVADMVSTVDLAATSLSLAGMPVPKYMDGVVFMGPEIEKREYIAASRDRGDETFDRIRAIRTEDYKYIRNFYPELPYTQYNHYKFNSADLYGNLNVMMGMHEKGTLDPIQDLFFQPVKPEEELYDVRADPWEVNNLAQDPAHAKKLNEMRSYLAEWIEYKNPATGWRDKGAIPEKATRTFIIEQDSPSSPFVNIVTTVDDFGGADISLQVEYSLDNGTTWAKAALAGNVTANYGQPVIDNRGKYQITAITTRNAGANTIRFKWDTQSEENGNGPVGKIAVSELRIRTTQFNGSVERDPHVSIGGLKREFPLVIENAEPFFVDLRDVDKRGSE